MNFDRATVHFPDGRIAVLTPEEFYAIPLGERIDLLTAGRLRFEKDNQPISPIKALGRS